jgi:hypothetical protein
MAAFWPYGNRFVVYGHTFACTLWIYGHNARMKKIAVHVSMPPGISVALKALAEIEGRAVSDILEELARGLLRSKGYEPPVTGEDIAARVSAINAKDRGGKGK